MASEEKDYDELGDLTETESSTSSSNHGIFDTSPYIMDVHEVTKDTPQPAVPASATDTHRQSSTLSTKTKTKKIKKKKKKSSNQAIVSSESASDTSIQQIAAVKEEPAKEEFYDARGSYHAVGQGPTAQAGAPPLILGAPTPMMKPVAPPALQPVQAGTPSVALPFAPPLAVTTQGAIPLPQLQAPPMPPPYTATATPPIAQTPTTGLPLVRSEHGPDPNLDPKTQTPTAATQPSDAKKGQAAINKPVNPPN